MKVEILFQRCRKCAELKSAVDFPPRGKNRPGELDGRCRPCEKTRRSKWKKDNPEKYRQQYLTWPSRHSEKSKRKQFKTRYKLSEVEYVDFIAKRDSHRCDSCSNISMTAIHLDHDHKTGRYRGALCRFCNHAIGMAMDDPQRLRLMADYLDRTAPPIPPSEANNNG